MKKWQQRELESKETRLKIWKLTGTVAEEFSSRVLVKVPTDTENLQEKEQEWGLLKKVCIEAADLCGRTRYGKM